MFVVVTWVLAEGGELVNLDKYDGVRVILHEDGDKWGVVARRYNDRTSEIGQSVLCEVCSEENAKAVIRGIASIIRSGHRVAQVDLVEQDAGVVEDV